MNVMHELDVLASDGRRSFYLSMIAVFILKV